MKFVSKNEESAAKVDLSTWTKDVGLAVADGLNAFKERRDQLHFSPDFDG